jgi:hypothetical protein
MFGAGGPNRLVVAARGIESGLAECAPSTPTRSRRARLLDLGGDGYVEVVRHEPFPVKRGSCASPPFTHGATATSSPPDGDFEFYRGVADRIAERFVTDAFGLEPDPVALGWRGTALRLAGAWDEAVDRTHDLLGLLGPPEARNADRRRALLATIGDLHKAKKAAVAAAASRSINLACSTRTPPPERGPSRQRGVHPARSFHSRPVANTSPVASPFH